VKQNKKSEDVLNDHENKGEINMKFEPIKGYIQGCLSCSQAPVEKLDLDTTVSFDTFDDVIVYIGDTELNYYLEDKDEITLREFVNRYRELIERTDAFMFSQEGALHGEIYEYNKEDSKFYLVKRTQGWA
jgi:hypothetical protein